MPMDPSERHAADEHTTRRQINATLPSSRPEQNGALEFV